MSHSRKVEVRDKIRKMAISKFQGNIQLGEKVDYKLEVG